MSSGSSGKLAQTTFETKPDDELAVVDVYESGSGGVENSFQDEYHSSDSDENQFADIAASAAGAGSDIMDAISSAMDQAAGALNLANNLNSVLNGLKNGNLGALSALTGGGSPALKGLLDLMRKANGVVNTVNNAQNSINRLTGDVNNIINSLGSNKPLATQLQEAARLAGTIKTNSNNLSSSMNRASNVLGGDKSSVNSIQNGTVVRAQTLENPSSYDNKTSLANKEKALDKVKSINPEIAVCINDLPANTQDALLRGFSDEAINSGMVVQNGSVISKLSPQASQDVIVPLTGIINSFNKEGSISVAQDPDALAVLISGTTHLSSKAGIKNTFTTMTKNIDNKDVIVKAAKPLAIRAINEGDVDIIIELSQSKAAKELNSFSTDLIPQLTKNIKRTQDKSQQDFAPHYKSIKRAFTVINPRWDTYTSINGKTLVNGCCISFNDFICDLIEACINENNNTLINDKNRQSVKNFELKSNTIVKLNPDLVQDDFTDQVQREVEKLNRDTYEKIFGETTMIIEPPDTPDPTVETPVEPIEPEPLDFTNEPFLLIASVFIDNSVEAEMQKHFPYLSKRFGI